LSIVKRGSGAILVTADPKSAALLASASLRAEFANSVPFFIRAWWLRDRTANNDLDYGEFNTGTSPLWSLHSDPICDAANMDFYEP
jgi:hypothetical protein